MTRKHFIEIARTIKVQRELFLAAGNEDAARGVEATARALCPDFKTANRAFDAQRFLTACGL